MNMQTVQISPEYSSFYVAGSREVKVPFGVENKPFVISPECINVSCLMWQDGDTTVSLGWASELDLKKPPSFDGMLSTPFGVVILFDVNTPEIMSMAVPDKETRIRIWTNHPSEPDEVIVALG
jgi:hypothetical protein